MTNQLYNGDLMVLLDRTNDYENYKDFCENQPHAVDKVLNILGRMIAEPKGDARVNVWLAHIGGSTGAINFTADNDRFYTTVDDVWGDLPLLEEESVDGLQIVVSGYGEGEWDDIGTRPIISPTVITGVQANVPAPRNVPDGRDDPSPNGRYGNIVKSGVQVIPWSQQVVKGQNGGPGVMRDGVFCFPCTKSKGIPQPWFTFRINPRTGLILGQCDNHGDGRDTNLLGPYFPASGKRD